MILHVRLLLLRPVLYSLLGRAGVLCWVYLLAFALLPAAGGNACSEQQLSRTEFAAILSLSQLHPAQVVLRNLITGYCIQVQIVARIADTKEKILATQGTILLLGGESTIAVPDSTNSAGECASLDVKADCAQRYSTEVFHSLADDPLSPNKTYDGGNPEVSATLNASVTEMASYYCDSHELFADVPPLLQAAASVATEEAELVAVGCPCDITSMYPLGGVEEGGFNVTMTISGLDTSRPKASGLTCLFNGVMEAPAQIVSTDTVLCVAPPLAQLMAAFSFNSSIDGSNHPGEVQLVPVDLRGAAFKISRSTNKAKFLRYYRTPTFVFPMTPGVFFTGKTPDGQRLVRVVGTNFNANVGGMYVRVSGVNGSSLLGQSAMTVIDTGSATALLPPSPEVGSFRFEISVDSDTWYHPGDFEYVEDPLILSLTPSSGPVRGGSLVTIEHTRVPFPLAIGTPIGTLEAEVGQYRVSLVRLSETQMTMVTPARTVRADPNWYFPGNESVEMYAVGPADPYTGLRLGSRISRLSNGSGGRFSYQCSDDEIDEQICCPVGTAGPGGSNGTFCFACEAGEFAPYVGTTACARCVANSISYNTSGNCSCVSGFEYQIIAKDTQECVACADGKFRNESMTSCRTCPSGTKASSLRSSCIAAPVFLGCQGSTYQPRNDTDKCCALGHLMPEGVSTCIPCPAGSFFNSSSKTCEDCAAGSFSASSGLLNCSRCLNGSYAPARQTSCLECPANSTGGPGATRISECRCFVGLARVSRREGPSICAPCAAGTYMIDTYGDAWCDQCPEGKSSPVDSRSLLNCTCAPNMYQNGTYVWSNASNSTTWVPEDTCDECPLGTSSYMNNNSGQLGIDACACPAGFAGNHSNAGQAGCGLDPYCGSPPTSTASSTLATTRIPVSTPSATSTAPSSQSTSTTAGATSTTAGASSNATTTTPAPDPSSSTAAVSSNSSALASSTSTLLPTTSSTQAPVSTSPEPFATSTTTAAAALTSSSTTAIPTTTPAPTPAPVPFCVDGNECVATAAEDWLGSPYIAHQCHVNATCVNTYGSYSCYCNGGAYGDGISCTACPSFSTAPYAATEISQCLCGTGLRCGQEEGYNGTDSANGTTIPALRNNLGGAVSFAFYTQPFSVGASSSDLSRGASATSLPLTECNLVDINSFLYTAAGTEPPLVPDANQSLWDCAPSSWRGLNDPISGTACASCPQVIIEIGAEEGADVVRVQLDAHRRVVYEVLPTCSCERCKVSWVSNVSLPLFAWTHVAVIQQSNGEVEIYLNGSQYPNVPSSASRRPLARTVERTQIAVGVSVAQPSTTRVFNGKLLDVAVWNATLTAAEISQLNVLGPRTILRSQDLALLKYSTMCDMNQTWKCLDIDECWTNGSTACTDNAVCTNTFGSYTCTCLSDFYLTENSTCASCGGNSTSRFGSDSITDCKCDMGFIGEDGAVCSACEAGQYKDVFGSAPCVGCPDHSFSPMASDNLTDCICNVGYSGSDGGPCTACPPGSYKDADGSIACTRCGAGKFSSNVGANSSGTCTDCAPGKYSNATGNAQEADCDRCSAGKYLNTSGNIAEGNCSLCPQGKYSATVGANSSDTCLDCAAGKYLNTAGNDEESDCLSCLAGKFLNTTGNDEEEDCVLCPCGKYSNVSNATTIETCLDCVAGKYAVGEGNDGEEDCTLCATGKYYAPGGQCSDVCLDCDAGKYLDTEGNDEASDCIGCPGNSTSGSASTAITDCRCNHGFSGEDGQACTPCEAGSYKNVSGAANCMPCPGNSTSSAGSASITDCQ